MNKEQLMDYMTTSSTSERERERERPREVVCESKGLRFSD